MTTDAMSDRTKNSQESFIRERLGSLLAFAPLGIWTFVHLWNNLAALKGAEAWQSSVTEYKHPIAQGLTMAIVLLPLLLHTIWGIRRLGSARPNNLRYGFYANLKYLLQRISSIGVLFFIAAHLWFAFLQPRLMLGHAEQFGHIAHEMRHNLPTLAVYLLGTLGVAYHLANGVHTFAMGWGIVRSRKALRRLEGAALGLFILLLIMSWGSIYALWRAGGTS